MPATTAARTIVSRRMARPARREQLLQAAAAAFLERGFDGTSMETVADHAGVTRMLVYRHFESKHALYRAVLTSAIEHVQLAVSPDAAGSEPGIAGQLVLAARQTPDAFRLLWRHARHEPDFAADALAFRRIAADFADEILRDLIPDPRRRHWSATLVVDFLYAGICNHLDEGAEADDAEFARHLHRGVAGMITAWQDGNQRQT
ncbi:MAG TPA: helix-turn-helix domain-containing protein [Ilumatobacter sp.]|nr:helix-turn-helix domain-containing protein [Ilumatobacter sp.]